MVKKWNLYKEANSSGTIGTIYKSLIWFMLISESSNFRRLQWQCRMEARGQRAKIRQREDKTAERRTRSGWWAFSSHSELDHFLKPQRN